MNQIENQNLWINKFQKQHKPHTQNILQKREKKIIYVMKALALDRKWTSFQKIKESLSSAQNKMDNSASMDIQGQFLHHCALLIQKRYRSYIKTKRYRQFLPIYRRVKSLLLAMYKSWRVRKILKLKVIKQKVFEIKNNQNVAHARICKRQLCDDLKRLEKNGLWVDALKKQTKNQILKKVILKKQIFSQRKQIDSLQVNKTHSQKQNLSFQNSQSNQNNQNNQNNQRPRKIELNKKKKNQVKNMEKPIILESIIRLKQIAKRTNRKQNDKDYLDNIQKDYFSLQTKKQSEKLERNLQKSESSVFSLCESIQSKQLKSSQSTKKKVGLTLTNSLKKAKITEFNSTKTLYDDVEKEKDNPNTQQYTIMLKAIKPQSIFNHKNIQIDSNFTKLLTFYESSYLKKFQELKSSINGLNNQFSPQFVKTKQWSTLFNEYNFKKMTTNTSLNKKTTNFV